MEYEQSSKRHSAAILDNSIKFGKILTNLSPNDEVVISGLSGRYPESNNVSELAENLFSKRKLTTDDERRWKQDNPEIPRKVGKLPCLDAFDAGYFGLHHLQSTQMDPICRIMLTVVSEAIFDAGLHPSDLAGTKTGVFVAGSFTEAQVTWFNEILIRQGHAITGNSRGIQANQISHFLKLKGPSVSCDTACSSSLVALEQAYTAIRMGQCDGAIVAGTNLCLNPMMSLQFARLGVASLHNTCRVFDNDAEGYVRAETICAIILQKRQDSKRVYSVIVHAKANCDGFKDSGITAPSNESQAKLMGEVYEECNSINAIDVDYLEAHGTGSKVGDIEELTSMDNVFMREERRPLLIGSIKSNMGHAEAASGLCSISKAIIAMETGYIPPNLNYVTPREGFPNLKNGRLRVVTDKTAIEDRKGIFGVNGFGFGGVNCHIVLRKHEIEKQKEERLSSLPILMCVSGRNRKAVDTLLTSVSNKDIDLEYIALLHEIFRKDIPNHPYRGYAIIGGHMEIIKSTNRLTTVIPKLLICFGTTPDDIFEWLPQLSALPIVKGTFQRIKKTLTHYGLDISCVRNNSDILLKTVANFVVQLLLVDLLKGCDVRPDKTYGIGLAALICAYFDRLLSLEEAVKCGYQIATAICSVNVKRSTTEILNNNKFRSTLSETCLKLFKLKSEEAFETILATGSKSNWSLLEIGNGEVVESLSLDKKRAFTCRGNINSILAAIGWLYQAGFNPQIQNLYPKVVFPVSRGTPMISSKIKWNNERKWFVPQFNKPAAKSYMGGKTFKIDIEEPAYSYFSGHVVDGRNLVPATGYLRFVWETLAELHNFEPSERMVVFENCKFQRATIIPEKNRLTFHVSIQQLSGHFEVTEGGALVASGKVSNLTNSRSFIENIPQPVGTSEYIAPHMTTQDVYTELRLRGYNYSGMFKCIHSCDSSVQKSKLQWADNWVTFLDSMLQLAVLQEDSRSLYVPTGIKRLVIDAPRHLNCVSRSDGEGALIDASACKVTGSIRSGFIDVRGISLSSIAKRQSQEKIVLEKYTFIPNRAQLPIVDAIRVNVQIVVENSSNPKVKVVELIDEAAKEDYQPLGDSIFDVLEDTPLVEPDVTILTEIPIETTRVKVENKNKLTEKGYSLIVGSRFLERNRILQVPFDSVKKDGFLLSREHKDFQCNQDISDQINIVTVFATGDEILVLFQKRRNGGPIYPVVGVVVKISSEDPKFFWLPKIQNAIAEHDRILIISQGSSVNGGLGLISCLRKEIGSENVRLVVIEGQLPAFDQTLPFYREQLKKNLAINIYKNNEWGTYRHLLINRSAGIEADHFHMQFRERGNLSSLAWIEGLLTSSQSLGNPTNLVNVYYAAVNFKDLMTASGKINNEDFIRDRLNQGLNSQGLEFSGVTMRGQRVAGMLTGGACASTVEADEDFLWKVPSNWTLREAATVPVVYATVLYGLVQRAGIKKGQSILIHSGSGGVGLAAIHLALHYGCTVYTTVGTPEKVQFLREQFKEHTSDLHISNSRSTEFERDIMRWTKGKGVDLVLNSLAEEKLLASVRCLAYGGKFVEIGKYDISANNELNLLLFEKSISFYVVQVDMLLNEKLKVKLLLQNLIDCGVVRPLPNTVFDIKDAESAYRQMTTGKHVGKILIEIRKETDNMQPLPIKIPCLPRYYCDPQKSYIISGGLGGFGLELADWLILRNCRNLVLVSRSGVKTGYQAYRIAIWKSYGCSVLVSKDDLTTEEGCVNLLRDASALGPVDAIFNLALVLKDNMMTNQTQEAFNQVFAPKVQVTKCLDVTSRKICPELRNFVVFSSASCSRGQAGQTNYGMANSIAEQICEQRRESNLPGLAIEWGVVGEVGALAVIGRDSNEVPISGTYRQSISSCLEALDILLKQKEAAIVSSIVAAKVKESDNIIGEIVTILGIKDITTISLEATLTEIGMDSMTRVEIKQVLEQKYDVFLAQRDIKNITLSKLLAIQEARGADGGNANINVTSDIDLKTIFALVPSEEDMKTMVKFVDGESSQGNNGKEPIILLPGGDGSIDVMKPLYSNMNNSFMGIQYTNDQMEESIEEMAERYLPIVEQILSKDVPFRILGYSFGGSIALKVANLLEQQGYQGNVVLIEGAPEYTRLLVQSLYNDNDDKTFQMNLITYLLSLVYPNTVIHEHKDNLLKCADLEGKINYLQSALPILPNYSAENASGWVMALYKRLKALLKWSPEFKLSSQVYLCKATVAATEAPQELTALQALCERPITVKSFTGDHYSVLKNLDLANAIDEFLSFK